MTNQEAIRLIRNLPTMCVFTDAYGEPIDSDAYYEATKLAIKAMEAQEWVPVNKKSHPDTPIRVQVQLDNGWIITAYYQENEWLSVPDYGEPIEDRWIEAWRPLPELYMEEENETD